MKDNLIKIEKIDFISQGDPSVGLLSSNWKINNEMFIEKDNIEEFRKNLQYAFELIADDIEIYFTINGESEYYNKYDILETTFWYMHDNHTFSEIKGKSLDEIKENYKKITIESPYGMVCSVVISENGVRVRNVGENIHHHKGKDIDFTKWENAIKNDSFLNKKFFKND
jgi:hypothetical protein